MLELTLQEMLDAEPSIRKIMECEGLPVKVAYRFAKLQKQFIKEMKEFQEMQTKVYQDNGGIASKQDGNGMVAYHFGPDAKADETAEERQERLNATKAVLEKVKTDIDGLLAEPVSFEFLPCKLDEIGKLEEALTPNDYRLLERFIVE